MFCNCTVLNQPVAPQSYLILSLFFTVIDSIKERIRVNKKNLTSLGLTQHQLLHLLVVKCFSDVKKLMDSEHFPNRTCKECLALIRGKAKIC